MTDNRALWKLVDELRKDAAMERTHADNNDWADWVREKYAGRANGYYDAATRLAAILERPVVVGEKQVGDICEKAAKSYLADTYKFKEFSQESQHMCRHFVREALESMVRGKS